ncbi:MAG: hypothetical protein IJ121_02890 [Eubacterium sp.]|nr:hypothetical protein [Eubacterium sp.]
MNVTTDSGEQITVYRNRVEAIAAQYVESLPDPTMIKETACFRGLLKTVYKEIFRASGTQLHNTRTTVNLEDVDLLNSLWDMFTDVCYTYGHVPTLAKFGLMIGISAVTFSNWQAERSRNKTLSHFKAVKDWKAECEGALEDRAIMSNSIGSIFALKCSHNWRETAPLTIGEQESNGASQTPEQIMMKYRNVERPTLPQMDDN